MMKRICRLCVLLMLLCSTTVVAQQVAPFQDEIHAFRRADSLHAPQQHIILFVGSSSFRLWSDVQNYFPDYPIINRGFGGAVIPDVIYYAEDVIFPYAPRQIVVYCGENDVAGGTDSKDVAEHFKQLFFLIRKRLPNVSIAYVGMKPSPSREKYFAVMQQGNQLIKNFLWQQPHTVYINVWDVMLDNNGHPRTELFRDDMLHMKPAGYALWKQAIEPYLLK